MRTLSIDFADDGGFDLVLHFGAKSRYLWLKEEHHGPEF